MIAPINTVAAAPSTTADQRTEADRATPSQPQTQAPTPPPSATQDQPLRLVVEPLAGSIDGYTYKLFDRATGALLIELPRETAAKMGAHPNYSAGQVFNAKA